MHYRGLLRVARREGGTRIYASRIGDETKVSVGYAQPQQVLRIRCSSANQGGAWSYVKLVARSSICAAFSLKAVELDMWNP